MSKYKTCMKNGIKYYRYTLTTERKRTKSGNRVGTKRKTLYAKTVKELDKKIADLIEKQRNGIVCDTLYFGAVADSWIKNEYIMKDRNTESTKATYLRSWDLYVRPSALYDMPLDDITGLTISALYQDLFNSGVSETALMRINRMMKKLYGYISLNRLGFDNSRGLDIPRSRKEVQQKKIKTWTDQELYIIQNSFDQAYSEFRLRFLLILAIHTGCRVSELLGLDKADINEKDRTLHINKQLRAEYVIDQEGNRFYAEEIVPPKTHRSIRTIPLNDTVMREYQMFKQWQLMDQKKHSYVTPHLFTTENGTFYNRANVTRALNRYYKTIGVPCKNIHCYRHTFASKLSREGVPIETASALLGHEDISTTAKYYVDVTPDQMRSAIAVLG